MDMATALAQLGVTERTLDEATRERLDRDGYAPLPGMLTEEQLARARTRVAELAAAEGDAAGREVHQEAGTDRLADLVNKDPVFEVCFTDPRLLACIAHVLGDFKLSSLNSRAALPGAGLQALHAGGRPAASGRTRCATRSGCLTISPRRTGRPGWCRARTARRFGPRCGARSARPVPRQVTLTAPAGTVIVFNSHLWHGGTRNNTDRPRRAMHSYFTGAATGSSSTSARSSVRRPSPGSARPPPTSSTCKVFRCVS